MPRSLDPNSRLTLVLACDVDKVPQPRIFARNPTINQQRSLIAAMQSMSSGDPAKTMEAALDAAMVCLLGWENMTEPETGMPIEFSREKIGDVLTIDELVEIFGVVTSASTPSVDDKKKSE